MSESLKILAVDDELGMRKGIERALQGYHIDLPEIHTDIAFQVVTAGSGEDALNMVEQDRPDILLLDQKLPGMSGLEVLEHIRTGSDDILVIMITAYASLETAVTAIKRGAYDFLAKPFTPAEIRATVQKASESLVMARQAKKLAQEKRQVRFQFISVLAHELKAPLASVQGYLEIIRDRSVGDALSDYDNIVDRCIMRTEGMRKMIMDLLDLTRIESGQKQRHLTDVNLVDTARNAIELVTPTAEQRGIKVHLHADQPVALTADQGEIDIIFNNLISNAVKYNRNQGTVDVTLASDAGSVVITVADTGIGMTPEEASRLFQDFVRIKNEKTRRILGSGLGLSLVKKLASLYQGQVHVSSAPDQGSTFTVRLNG